MEAKDIVNSILFIRPNAQFSFNDNEITWTDKIQTQPTQSEIDEGFIAYNAAKAAAETQAANAKATAEAKLAALGLTADDLKALGL